MNKRVYSISLDYVGADVYVHMQLKNSAGRVNVYKLTNASLSRFDYVLQTLITKFEIRLTNIGIQHRNAFHYMRFERIIQPNELGADETNKAIMLHVLYPTLFDLPEGYPKQV